MIKDLMRRIFILSICFFTAIIISGCSFINGYTTIIDKDRVLFIPLNATYPQLLDSLAKDSIDISSFISYASVTDLKERFKPGRYALKGNITNKELVRVLSCGWQNPFMVTISGNIRGVERLAGLLGKKLAYDSLSFINAFNNDSIIKSYGFKRETFGSIVLPNTYEMFWTISPEEFIARMDKEYKRFWNSNRLQKAEEIGLSQEQVSILASIICEESNYVPEYKRIAGVYVNRYNKGLLLQADPTVKFALNDPTIKRILYKHLEVDSPYNTYKNLGLPPGIITIPSIAAIDAVLNYEKHSYLYFCASDALDGTHKFAKGLKEHNKNAKAYQDKISKL